MSEISLKKYSQNLKPMALNEFYERIEQSEKIIKEGRTISQENLEKEIENW